MENEYSIMPYYDDAFDDDADASSGSDRVFLHGILFIVHQEHLRIRWALYEKFI